MDQGANGDIHLFQLLTPKEAFFFNDLEIRFDACITEKKYK